ncbi:hypothetical protein EV187_3433 [Agromyces ramosus]|uniref:Alpha/beta hydrolase family protein n=1 Tax=Agromyces ramosus TaxID=33879 RepID=A0A4Q7M8N1_9MICO|nr:hypothetical protein [Agromyces ramosus]RZS63527.1 hypothetical protein EV187_3433 [Agromyces ramosus]
MSGDLTVSGGGSTAVAIDALFVDAARLGATIAVVGDWIDRAAVIRRGLHVLDLDVPSVIGAAGSPTLDLAFAGMCLDQGLDRARWLRSSLVEAAERYGATERLVDGLWRLGAFIGAPWLGFHAPALLTGGLLAAGGLQAGSAAWRAAGWGSTPLEAWLVDHRGMLSDPDFVRLVRVAVDHADEVVAGAARLPFAGWIGSAVGAPESASLVLGLAGLLGVAGSRVLVDRPVRVQQVDPAGLGAVVPPPAGIGELADRVPTGDDGSQIRIERYGPPDDPRWIVYIGGTVDFGLVAAAQPADMTSNLHGIADDSALDALRLAGADSGAGERAVREAMREAGVEADDPLLAVGHSGGGLIAAGLAGDPELNAMGAVSLGGPVASAPTREGVGVLSIEHEEDLVPATGGAGHPSPDRVTVSRSVLDPGREYGAVFPAHELARYRETAAMVDGSEEARLASFRSLVAEVTGGGDGLRSDWVATREVSSSTTGGR